MLSWLFRKNQKQAKESGVQVLEASQEDTDLLFQSLLNNIILVERARKELLDESRIVLAALALKYGEVLTIPKSMIETVKKNDKLGVTIKYDNDKEELKITLEEFIDEANKE